MLERLEIRFDPTPTTEGEFSGYAVTWGTVDSYRTAFAPGAFAASLGTGRPVALLWSHDPAAPVGTITELREDERGLFVRARLALATTRGREAYELLKAGAVNGLSVGFVRRRDEAMAGGRRITEAVAKEVSIVTLPSNESARIVEVRADHAASAAQPKGKAMDKDTVTDAAPDETRGTDTDDFETRMSGAVETLTGTVNDLRSTIEATTKRLDKVEARSGRAGAANGTETRSGVEAEHRALAALARGDDKPMIELRSMWSGSDPDGGYVVMPELSKTMTKKLFDATPMRRLARVETITQGDAWVEPIDADDIGATWVGEREARTDTDTAELGLLTVPLREIQAQQPITQRLLDDSGINLGAWIEGKITDKFTRSEGAAFISATTTPKRPAGLLSYATAATADATRPWGTIQFVKSGDNAKITADGLKNLVWALRAPYRDGAVFLMNSNTANALDTLVDTEGRYLWRSSMTAGAPNSLLGYPVEFDETMPDIAGNAVPVAFGNFKRAYLIVDKLGTRFIRDNLTDKPNVLFYAYRRVGGGLANSEAVKLQKIAS
ncbi:phage major capsid protein [Rhodospira trueperi]|uniref:Phage prohead protease, HK97 family/phage major capsid protein, HK97 family,TIGR01554 n=1 Tax=Rhodospira trueperi TaxID=69960 RepID=A0A1G6X247_9PROT|nr:phage major capsid protein [Rhodospira trueperi]SDD72139.1 phage prohead protease, HK97 family/phage major capsid protein, HK97 family,TIGR01554 [Rhodospira trueperi]